MGSLDEINPAFVRQHAINAVRRRSRGGAVYHDHGNPNFSFITNRVGGRAFDFQMFTATVLELRLKPI